MTMTCGAHTQTHTRPRVKDFYPFYTLLYIFCVLLLLPKAIRKRLINVSADVRHSTRKDQGVMSYEFRYMGGLKVCRLYKILFRITPQQ